MAVEETNSSQQRPEVFSKRRRRMMDVNLVLMCLAVCVIIIELNFLSFRHYRRWDMTGQFELSDRTRILLESLVSDVKVFCIWGRGIGLDEQVRDIRDELEQYTDKLDVQFLDPYIEKSDVEALTSKYGLQANTTEPRMLFVRGTRFKLFSYSDIVQIGFQPRFKGESVFYQGITNVISNEITKIYFLAGHNEMDIHDPTSFLGGMQDAFAAESWEVDSLDLTAAGRVPADCSMLAIIGPGTGGRQPYEFSVDECNAMDAYMQRGGRLLALIDPMRKFGKVSLPNGRQTPQHWHYAKNGMEEFFANWGVLIYEPKLNTHGVVLDKAKALRPDQWQNFVVTDFPPHAITRDMNRFTFVVSYVRKVQPNPAKSDIQKKILFAASEDAIFEPEAFMPRRYNQELNFSDQSFLAKHQVKQSQGMYKPAPHPFAVTCTKRESKESEQVTKLVVMGTSRFLDKTILDFNRYNWYPLLNSMKWLLTSKDVVESPPPPVTSKVTLTAERSDALFWNVVAIIPGIALLLGMCIWWVRRS